MAQNTPKKVSLAKWIIFLVCYLSVLGVVIFLSRRIENLHNIGNLAIFIAYLSMAFTLCPLPIYSLFPWIIQYFDPLTIALLGSVATCIANLNDYHIFYRLYQLKGVAKLKEKEFYKEAVKWFDKAPFIAQAVVNFSPIPIDVVRLLAISVGYPRWKFALATFIGRFPRYLIIVWGSGLLLKWLDNVMLAVFAILVIAFLLVGIGVLIRKIYKKRQSK